MVKGWKAGPAALPHLLKHASVDPDPVVLPLPVVEPRVDDDHHALLALSGALKRQDCKKRRRKKGTINRNYLKGSEKKKEGTDKAFRHDPGGDQLMSRDSSTTAAWRRNSLVRAGTCTSTQVARATIREGTYLRSCGPRAGCCTIRGEGPETSREGGSRHARRRSCAASHHHQRAKHITVSHRGGVVSDGLAAVRDFCQTRIPRLPSKTHTAKVARCSFIKGGPDAPK